MLKDLLGRGVTVNDNKSRLAGEVLWARYATADGSEEAIWSWDVSSGISVGAALTMVPSDQAQKDIRSKQVDAMTLENFQEVANILGSLLNEERKDPLILKEVGFDDVKKGKVAEKNKAMDTKHSYNIDVEGYGSGATQLRCTG